MPDFPHLRAHTICPNCREAKDIGLILCWPCHRAQKAHNDGRYSKRLTRKIEIVEETLADLVRSNAQAN